LNRKKRWILIALITLIAVGLSIVLIIENFFEPPDFYGPMHLGHVYLFSGNDTMEFSVYNPNGAGQTTVSSVIVNGTGCANPAWTPIPSSGTLVSESCNLSSSPVAGQNYEFKISFSNGVSISGGVTSG